MPLHFKKVSFAVAIIFGLLLVGGIVLYLGFRSGPPGTSEVAISPEVVDGKLAPRSNTVDITSNKNDVTPTTAIVEEPKPNQAAVTLAVGCQLTATIAPIIKTTMVQYGITFKNRGSEDCQNVTYSVYYPENEFYSNANPKPSASDYYWRVGTIKSAGTSKKFQVTTRFTDAFGGIELCATATNMNADACATATLAAGDIPVLTIPTKSIPPVPTSSQTPMPPVIATPQTAEVAIPVGKEYGVWEWNSPVTMTAQKMDQVVAAASAAHFNVVYLTIDDVQNYDHAVYSKALALFITKATAKGIAVDAVVGARDWAKVTNRSKGYAMIDFAIFYNKLNPKLRGFQYDVEPYLLPEYEGNKESVLTDFVTFIDESERRLHGSGLTFGVVIPHFYDSSQAWTPKVTFAGTTNHAFTHVLSILDRGTGNSILIMSYRNYFAGKGGTEELSTPEINEASKTKVIVAQETGNVEPSYVTFYGTSKSSLYSSLNSIFTTFSAKPGFGGAAVHYLDPFIVLK